MIEHVYRRTAEARGVGAVVVATDDERIAAAVERFGGIVRMTQAAHRTGTDRIAEIARDLRCEMLVNVQGDLPLVDPRVIEQVIDPLRSDPTVRMSTVCLAITDPADYTNPNVVKVVRDLAGDALYFSRSPIPFVRAGGTAPADPGRARIPPHDVQLASVGRVPRPPGAVGRGPVELATVYKHIGLYGYRRDWLLEFAALPQTPLEQAESLEQLRALEHGVRIRAVETGYESIEVDTADDLERVRRLVAAPARA